MCAARVACRDETGAHQGPRDQHLAVDTERWADLAGAVLAAEGVHHGELGLVFVTSEAIAVLNGAHLGSEGPTDVLAFPIDAAESDPSPGDALIGDVVVCPAYAQHSLASGATPSGCLEDELALLVVHGVLHVLGYDHHEPAEAAVMEARQQELLAAHHHHVRPQPS